MTGTLLLAIVLDLAAIAAAYVMAVLFRIGGRLELGDPLTALALAVIVAGVQVVMNLGLGAYRRPFALASRRDIVALLVSSLAAAVVPLAVNAVGDIHPIPTSSILVAALGAVGLELTIRLQERRHALSRVLFGQRQFPLAVTEELIVTTPNLESILVRASDPIRRAIEAIDRDVSRIALVVDEQRRLLGTITDGDVRRAILAGRGLDESAGAIMHGQPVSAPASSSDDDILIVMQQHAIRQVPLVDEAKRVVDVRLLELLAAEAPEACPVVVMAGGLGRRLGPLTRQMPKPLMRVGGRPVLEMLLRDLASQGFRQVVLAVNYRADAIEQHFGNGSQMGIDIRYVREEQPLGTAGAIRLAAPYPTPDFVVVNADILTRVSFRGLLDFHREQHHELTIAAVESTVQLRYGLLQTSGTRVIGIVEKPLLRNFVNAGIYVLNERVLDLIPLNQRSDMDQVIVSALADGLRVGCFPIREYWADIGDPDDLRRVSAEWPGIRRGEQASHN